MESFNLMLTLMYFQFRLPFQQQTPFTLGYTRRRVGFEGKWVVIEIWEGRGWSQRYSVIAHSIN